MLKDAIQAFEVNPQEYGILLESAYYNANYFKIRLNKLMPQIPQNTNISNETYNINIFSNATNCSPGKPKRVKIQNFILAKRSSYAILANAAEWDSNDNGGYIPAGKRVLCDIISNNINEVYVRDAI